MQETPIESPSKLSYAAVVTSPAKPKARTPSPDAFKAVIKIPAMSRLIQGKAKQAPSEPKGVKQGDQVGPQTKNAESSELKVNAPDAPPTYPETQQAPLVADVAPPTRKQAKKARAKARKAMQMEATTTTPTGASTDSDAGSSPVKNISTSNTPHVTTATSTTPPNDTVPGEPPVSPTPSPSPPRLTAAEKGKNKINPFTADFSLRFTKNTRPESTSHKRKAEESPPKPNPKKNTNEANPPLHTPQRLTIVDSHNMEATHSTNATPTIGVRPSDNSQITGSWYTMSGEKIVEPRTPARNSQPRHPPKRIPIHSPTPIRIQPSVKDLERSLEIHLANVQAYTGSEKQYNEQTMQIQESIVAAEIADRASTESPMKIDEDPFDQPSSYRGPGSSGAPFPSSPQTPTPSTRGSTHSYTTSRRLPNPQKPFPNLFSDRDRHLFPQTSNHHDSSPRDRPDRLPAASPISYDSDNLSMVESEPWASSAYPNMSTNSRLDRNTTHLLSHNYRTHRDQRSTTPNRDRNRRTFTFNPFSPQPDNTELPGEDAPDPKLTWTPADIPGILINGVGLQRTAEPPLGWHRPEFKIGPLHNLSDSSKADVARAAPHSIWLLPLRANNRSLDELGMADTIRGLLDLLITSPHRSRRVGTTFMKANAGAKQESRFEFPYFILITGISPEQSDLLLQYFCISTPNATFWTFPLNMPKSHFAGTIAGLHHTEDDIEEVRDIITNQLLSNDHASLDHFVTTNSYPFNESAYRSLISNIHLSFVLINHNRNTTHRAWNLVLPTNNLNNQDTISFLKLLNEVKFKTDGFGLGYFLSLNEIPMCEGCKSLGHYYHKCPYLEIEGWMGPKLTAPTTTNQPHNWSEVYEHDRDQTSRTKTNGYQQRGNPRPRATYRGGYMGRGRGDSRKYR